MNTEKAQEAINKIIESQKRSIGEKFYYDQYAATKKQIAQLTELGIYEMIPWLNRKAGIGWSNAQVIIDAAHDSGGKVEGGWNPGGDGWSFTSTASALYLALNEVEETVEVVETAKTVETVETVEVTEEPNYSAIMQDIVNATLNEEIAEWIVSGFYGEPDEIRQQYRDFRQSQQRGLRYLNEYAIKSTKLSQSVDIVRSEVPAEALIYSIRDTYTHDTIKQYYAVYLIELKTPMEDSMTTAEIAAEFGIADATVRQTIARGALSARKISGVWLVERSEAARMWGHRTETSE